MLIMNSKKIVKRGLLMWKVKKRKKDQDLNPLDLSANRNVNVISNLKNDTNMILSLKTGDMTGGRYRYDLYRFLTDNIPVINAAVSTWVRLSAAAGQMQVVGTGSDSEKQKALIWLDEMTDNVFSKFGKGNGNLSLLLSDLFRSLYQDGLYAGFVALSSDGSRVDKFVPIDVKNIVLEPDGSFYLEIGNHRLDLSRSDFYYIPFNTDFNHPLGRSMLKPIPFVSYIEQQLVEDMRRSTHNSGYHRLHVKVTPPERMGGESDKVYIDRINNYFDSTVSMIKNCDVDENPVTWNNIEISSVGPENVRTVTNSWFMNHRAMIEEICAGTNLAPFLLGYSFGATSTWSSFKFDIVMRQVKSIQSEAKSFVEWLGNIHLALGGYDLKCNYVFDNSLAYQATELAEIRTKDIDNILRLYEAGLIDETSARSKAGKLI